jgi:hypothetical protein
MTLLECVNRILRLNAIIRGDTDVVSSFSETAHNASLNIAILAIQTELIQLIAKRMIPKERDTSGSITLASQTRTYDLASDFIRFFAIPHLYSAANNRQIYEYRGGLGKLQVEIYNYATQYGSPNWWYWEPVDSANKKIGLFLVPDAASAGQVWTYDYEASVMVTNESDVLPFHNDEESFTFTEMAGRRFKYMYEDVKNVNDIQAVLNKDTGHITATCTLYALIKGQNPTNSYGSRYA